MHHHGRVRIGQQRGQPQRKVAVGAAQRARDGHLAVFFLGAAIHQHEALSGGTARYKVVGAQAGRVLDVLDQLAKRLGGYVDSLEQGIAGGSPGGCAAVEHCHVQVAKIGEAPRCVRRHGIFHVAIVEQHDAFRTARCQLADFKLKAAVGQGHGEERMAFAVLAVLANVEQG